MCPETLIVEPINEGKLSKYLEKFIRIDNNQTLMVEKESFFFHPWQSFLIDDDCCAGKLEKIYNRETKSTEWKTSFAIRKSTKTENGESFPMYVNEYFDIPETELRDNNLLDNPISLKEFMGRRFGYNPRIETNTRIILKEIQQSIEEYNQYLKESQAS